MMLDILYHLLVNFALEIDVFRMTGLAYELATTLASSFKDGMV